MNKHFQCMSFMLIVLLCSCNSDIFIDRSLELPDVTEITLPGDDGSELISINPKGLEHIYINTYEDVAEYYSSTGKKLTWDAPASEIAYIAYNTELCEFTIDITGNIIRVKSNFNCSPDAILFPLRLEYDYAVKDINIRVQPGKQLEYLFCRPDKSFNVVDDAKSWQRSATYNNNSSGPMTVYVKPYQGASCIGKAIANSPWASMLPVEILVPKYDQNPDEDIIYTGHEVCFNTTFQYECDNSDLMEPVTVDAHSHVRVTVTVDYVRIDTKGTVSYLNQVTQNILNTAYTCQVFEPVNYHIDIESYETD